MKRSGGLYSALLAEPRQAVGTADIAAIEDADARENWQFFLGFRDRLMRHRTLEAAYTDLIRSGAAQKVPPLFINQLVHVILRNALDGCEDAEVVRAAELFFRTQRVTLHDKQSDRGRRRESCRHQRHAAVAPGFDARHPRGSQHRRADMPITPGIIGTGAISSTWQSI